MSGKKVNVFDIAAYILSRCGPMTAMKLQKLVYYSQAWSIVWDEEPLFLEKIEAWANGPVVYDLFKLHQGKFKVHAVQKGDPRKLSPTQRATVDGVTAYYGDKSSQWLSDLTHMEDPWKNARRGMPDNIRGSKEISHASMMEYYGSLKKKSSRT